jgi:GNAT superfamily N-acetyltransferase
MTYPVRSPTEATFIEYCRKSGLYALRNEHHRTIALHALGLFVAITIRRAELADREIVYDILREAAVWLDERGMPMWRDNELDRAGIERDVAAGLFYIAELDGAAAGTVRYQLSDAEFWPDAEEDDAAYVHRLAVRRRFSKCGVSTALLAWAVQRTAWLGRRFLRLDCEADRTRLRALYEDFGFRHHSDRRAGPYHVARYQYNLIAFAGEKT